jgi:hypothetical protein
MVTTTVIFNLIALSIVIYRQLHASHLDLWSLIPFLLFLLFLWSRARALKSRVAELVDLAAHRAGLHPIDDKDVVVAPVMPVQVIEAIRAD